jgi:hypothetical protein
MSGCGCGLSWLFKHNGYYAYHLCRRTKDLLKLNRDQLRWVVELLTGHCHLKGYLFKVGLTEDPICERCLYRRRWISHTYPVWLWGCSPFKISSPGPVLHGTKRLLWRSHIQSPILHSRCRTNKGLIKRGSTIDLQRSRCKGWFLWPTPYTYIHTTLTIWLNTKRSLKILHFAHTWYLNVLYESPINIESNISWNTTKCRYMTFSMK